MSGVYLVYFELSSRSESFQKNGYAGGFVTCVVAADDIRSSIEISERALIEDGYDIVDIDKAMRFEPDDWKHDTVVQKLVAQTSEDKETRYTEFEVWGH